jgi:hypothetical protein
MTGLDWKDAAFALALVFAAILAAGAGLNSVLG